MNIFIENIKNKEKKQEIKNFSYLFIYGKRKISHFHF